MSHLGFHIGDPCQRNIDGTWFPGEITKIFKTVASVRYIDDGKTEDEIPLDSDNLRRPYAVISPTTTMEDSGTNSIECQSESFFVEVGVSSTSTSPVSQSEDDVESNTYLYTNDDQLMYELGSSVINIGNEPLRPFTFQYDNIQSVPHSDLSHYEKKDFVHLHLPNGDVRLKSLFIPSVGDLHSARSVSKYLKMDYYWQQFDPSSLVLEKDRFLIPDLKPLAGMCSACERWSIFSCSKCFDDFYCNRKCQQKMWPHHKIYCGDPDLSTITSSESTKRYSRCNAYLQSVGYVPKQQSSGVTAIRRKTPNSNGVNCGTSMQEDNNSRALNGSAMVHPFDVDIERRFYTSPNINGTRKVYDIHDHIRPSNNSRAPPHHGLTVNVNLHHQQQQHQQESSNKRDDLDVTQHGNNQSRQGGGGLSEQWDWHSAEQFNEEDSLVCADAYLVGPADEASAPPFSTQHSDLQRVSSNNSLYCAHSPGHSSPLGGGGGDLTYDDDLDLEAGGLNDQYTPYFPMDSNYDMLTQSEQQQERGYCQEGNVTPPAYHHTHNTRSSSSLSSSMSRNLNSAERMLSSGLNPLHLGNLHVVDELPLEDDGEGRRLYDRGAMGRRVMSPVHSSGGNLQRHTRFVDHGYASDSEVVPALIPMSNSAGRVTEIDPQFEESVQNLVNGMGLDESLVREALTLYSGDLEQAVNYVLNQTTW